MVEKKNNKSFYFIHNMELLFVKSHYEFNFIDDKKGSKIDDKNYKLDVIVYAEDLSNNEANAVVGDFIFSRGLFHCLLGTFWGRSS
jgi:hypothetical protein